MTESNSIEIIDKTNSTEQTKFQLDETSKIENYFDEEVNQRKSCSKKLNKYVAAFDYIDKVLINCFRCNKWWGIYHFIYECCGAPVGIASASFTLKFSLKTGIIKKLLSTTRNKKKNHDKIFMLAKSKLNSIETLTSQALIDMEISHEEFLTILKEKGFTYSACGPFTKNKERIEKFMQTGNTDFITKMSLIKLVFNMIWLMANQKI